MITVDSIITVDSALWVQDQLDVKRIESFSRILFETYRPLRVYLHSFINWPSLWFNWSWERQQLSLTSPAGFHADFTWRPKQELLGPFETVRLSLDLPCTLHATSCSRFALLRFNNSAGLLSSHNSVSNAHHAYKLTWETLTESLST